MSHKIERAQERKRGFQEGGIEQMWRERGGGQPGRGGPGEDEKEHHDETITLCDHLSHEQRKTKLDITSINNLSTHEAGAGGLPSV